MNRIWAALAILIVLSSLCTVGTISTGNMTGDISASLTKVSAAIDSGDLQKAEKLSRSAAKQWHTYHKTMSMYIPHARLEAIDQTLSVLPPLIFYESKEEAQAECARALEQIKHLNDTELPTLDNIL